MESRSTEWRVENYGAELRPSAMKASFRGSYDVQSFHPFTVASLICEKNSWSCKVSAFMCGYHVVINPGASLKASLKRLRENEVAKIRLTLPGLGGRCEMTDVDLQNSDLAMLTHGEGIES